jgi:hypothetical protein
MASSLLIPRGSKIKLHKMAILNPTLYYDQYKTYCNFLTPHFDLAKNYIWKLSFREKPQKTWDLLKEVTFGKKNNKPIVELLNNTTCTDPLQIAINFSNLFSSKGSEIYNSVPSIDRPPNLCIPNCPADTPELTFDHTRP